MAFRTRFASRRRSGWRRYLDLGVAMLVIAGVAFVAARMDHFAGDEISGAARVVDGDSLAIGKRRLRLKGIDAPELKQRCHRDGFEYGCGIESASYLRGLVGKHLIECKGEGMDRYGRDLVRCKSGGVDLNETMVRSGHAIAFGDYGWAETAARSEAVGLWAGDFQTPKQWRVIHGGLSEDLHAGFATLMAFLRRLFDV
ncbi:micrococcal nuclease-like nuclease [Hoeflea sp. IMCC20628]|uniref:thermonuclease family protein n=1 Tax=Hoeflea sp. IMCC20628 TaxID=1620421 RepID=UPI00063AF840|nr:thermonuclease family protein [Hoeflea sp. IMCC20628]AKI00145.1 micrococcal nuclease-like nuclease [Hoeflea sp. IMCC20628]